MDHNSGGPRNTSNSTYGSYYNYNRFTPTYSQRQYSPQKATIAQLGSSGTSNQRRPLPDIRNNTSPNSRTRKLGSQFDSASTSFSLSHGSEYKTKDYSSLTPNDIRQTSGGTHIPVTSRSLRAVDYGSGAYTGRMPGNFSNYPDVNNQFLDTRVPSNFAPDESQRSSRRGRSNTSKEEFDQSLHDSGAAMSSSHVGERSRNKSGSPRVQRKVVAEAPPSYEESLTEGTVGLENMGNTCYFNSAIQCISNTTPLRDVIVGSNYKIQESCDTKGKIISVLNLLLKDIWLTQKPFSSVRPRECLKAVADANPQFEGYRQQDAQEMLLFLLNALSEETNRVSGAKASERRDSRVLARPNATLNNETADRAWERFLSTESSFVTDVIAGQLESILECTECLFKSVTYESFFQMSLPIPSEESSRRDRSMTDITLDDCFKLFCEEEILEGDNAVLCERCRKPRRCSKGFKIQRLPDVLIIQIKRFSIDFRTKIDTPVVAPLKNLCLVEYMTEFQKRLVNPPVYRLSAVIDHMGSPRNGHYVAKCLVPPPPSSALSKRAVTNSSRSPNVSRTYPDDKRRSPNVRSPSGNRSRAHSAPRSKSWWLFDDSSVTPVDERDVVSPYNYILFYEKERD